MTSYFLLFFIVLLLSLYARRKKQDETSILVFIATLIFLFFGFREGFTLDFEIYSLDFSSGFISDRHEKETLYKAMTRFFSYRFALILQALFFCILLFISFKKHITQDYWWLGFVVLFFNFSFLIGFFSGFRSSFVTMAVFLAVLAKIKMPNKGIGMIIGGVLIYASSLVHYSGLSMLPILLLPIKPVDEGDMRIVRVIAIISISIFLFASSVFSNYLTAFLQTYADEALYYMEDNNVANYYFSLSNIVALAAKVYLLFYSLAYMSKKNSGEATMFIGVTAILFFIALMPNLGLITRLTYYTLFPSLIGITYMMKHESNSMNRLIFLGCLTIYLFFKYRNFVIGGYSEMMQYNNILFN